ncbi:pancreatic lipase-related protein 2-like isoform X2 [Hydra vulgaris]|uniref:Pancreatic lipase-related protein 2-like isoform X2 n=1 Tax=Hydra vulgaris TaxID=6087 RepID=A0ABM4C7V5_HYDVU
MVAQLFWYFVFIQSILGGEICYPPYGCFNDSQPYDRPLARLPESPDKINTVFTLYTRKAKNLLLHPLFKKTASSVNFNPNLTTVFITHGYIESIKEWYVQMFIDELLKYEDMNVVFVDWSGGSGFPYHQAYGNVRLVGAQLSYLIENIRNDTGINWQKLHLIGFSIGSHLVGYAGRFLRLKGLLVPRITVLDPAAPLYEYQHTDTRIDPTDAEFVDVIHTDTNTLLVLGFGAEQQMGHLDFYPNGGYYQKGCEKLDISVTQYLVCSHYRSIRYFMESINSQYCFYEAYPCKSYEDFKAEKCSCPTEGCPVMGYHAKKPKTPPSTRYYLETRSEFPFCGVQYKLKIKTGTKFLGGYSGKVTVTLYGENGFDVLNLPSQKYDSGTLEDVFYTGKKELGKLIKVDVSTDAFIDNWFLISLSVKHKTSGQEYQACYKKWLKSGPNEENFTNSISATCDD